ncbi:atpase h -transporting v1 subunit e1a-related [Anaeramoeba flamelloides]|uniref:Atpase h -transporting v1 subunit e1a-related n=1 Tax=Anaeramoeba flamelloides TaxID=1746091 RepID=A0AAV7YLE8_9EUKA|nr:atpase h -transporting v1 subunit e1a-related [Anaeramoeba flamelloides]KAJ3448581.1 atpase h -transporting v1 subunit e1a-related [Anaeramoeba flamelloides]KAJ6228781.1 atpase h -transporting v1 subunit e1a-related [Anaeramoeba flamelloides]KAJ6246304.1 atpase h -transporting v1 subunit e1a-related [Anaeramoeba flamelloides]
MNYSQRVEQTQKMIDFIQDEAEETIIKIQEQADEEFENEKSNLVDEERKRIIEEFERKRKQLDVKRKISQSSLINQSRLKILKAKYQYVQNSLKLAHFKLVQISQDQEKYPKVLKELILQGLLKMMEERVILMCRKCDLGLVKKLLKGIIQEFKKLTKMDCKVLVLEKQFLPPPPQKNSNRPSCSGGVVLNTANGKITCTNTLDYRLLLAFEGLLPEIRRLLFEFNADQVDGNF